MSVCVCVWGGGGGGAGWSVGWETLRGHFSRERRK